MEKNEKSVSKTHLNKLDKAQPELIETLKDRPDVLFISAEKRENLVALKERLLETIDLNTFKGSNTIVTNIRRYDSLLQTKKL